jgi:HPr kinase/phosphorylase
MDGLLAQELEQNREHHLELTLMAGRKGIKKKITHSQVQKMGLAMAGFIQFINPERIQIIGNTEATYFKTLPPEMQEKVIRQICSLPLSSLVVTRGLEIPELLLREAEEREIPVFRTNLRSVDFIERITKFLEEKLASTSSLHGVLMDI